MKQILYVHVSLVRSDNSRDDDKWFTTMEDAIKWYQEK
jgi:hypothetical protein